MARSTGRTPGAERGTDCDHAWMTPRPPLLILWCHSSFQNSSYHPLHLAWPADWLYNHGAIRGVVSIAEEHAPGGAYRVRAGRAPTNADCAGAAVLAIRPWHFQLDTVRALRAQGYRLVTRLDDDLWHLPPWAPWAAGPAGIGGLSRVEEALEAFDAVAVTTDALAAIVAPFVRQVVVIPNALPVAQLPRARAKDADEPLTIGWAGTATHDGDLAVVQAPLAALLSRHPQVRLVIMSRRCPAWLRALPRVTHRPAVGFAFYYEILASYSWDIALAPLAEHVFNESKSNLKALDFAALGIPLVASRVGPYRDLPHGETCLTIADNDPDLWLEALETLLADPARRQAMGAAARRWVETSYSLGETGPLWAAALGLSLRARVASASA